MPILGAILGATASGKSELAVLLAQKLNAEIICMDSRQVFKNFKIGTAQPSSEELKAAKHNLVDFLPPENQYSAAEFAKDAKKLLAENPGANFILTGGTGLYMQALCLGLNPLPPASPETREKLKAQYKSKPEELYQAALKANPGIENKIMPKDAQRLLRVLELNSANPENPENSGPGNRVGGIGPVPSIWLDFPRGELYGRINSRVAGMLKNGWIEEVEGLAKTVPANAPAWQSLGYAELKQALENGSDPFSAEEQIALKSRRYAKRQITWFRHKESPVCIDGKNAKSESNLKKITEIFLASSS